MRRTIFATAATVILLQSAQAQAAPQPPAAASADAPGASNDDPWEKTNRAVYKFNQGLDKYIIRPAAMGYKTLIPEPIRFVVRNALENLHQPVIIINDFLQGRFARAGRSTARLAVNSTLGIGGLYDVATHLGLPHHDTSFGVTLGRYGVKMGPYVYIPVAGPSTIRNIVGMGVDTAFDPLYWISYPHKVEISLYRGLIDGLDTRVQADAQLKAVTADATDPYATLRSVYLQNEQSKVNGDTSQIQALPDFDDPEAPSKPAATAGAVPVEEPPAPAPDPAAAAPAPAPAPAPDAAAEAPHAP